MDGKGLADRFQSAPAELLGSICLHHVGSLGCVHSVGPMEFGIAMKHQNIDTIRPLVPVLLGHQGWKVWLAD